MKLMIAHPLTLPDAPLTVEALEAAVRAWGYEVQQQQGITPFGPLVTAAIEQVNGFAAREQTVLGDGAAWIWRLGAEVLPDAALILDRWHLRDARRRATRAAIPDKALRQPWSIRLEDALDGGDVPDACLCSPRCSNGIRTGGRASSPTFSPRTRARFRIMRLAVPQGGRLAAGRWRKG